MASCSLNPISSNHNFFFKPQMQTSVYVHPAATSLWPRLHTLLLEIISARGLQWQVSAQPAAVPSPVDFVLVPGKAVNASWLAEHQPSTIIMPHAGIPPTVQAALTEAGGVKGGLYNVRETRCACVRVRSYAHIQVHHNNRSTGEVTLMLPSLDLGQGAQPTDTCRQCRWH